MKIAMVGQKGIPAIYGGIERHVEELSKELASKGNEVLVYARSWYTPKTLKNHFGVKIVHKPTINTKHLDAIIHTFISSLDAIKKKADVIHYHGVGPSLLSFLPRILSPKTKVIATFHCIDRYHQKWNWFARLMLLLGEKAACAFPHQTISVSKTIQNYCINEFKINTTYIPNGVGTTEKQEDNILEKWNLDKDKYILMVSRLVKHKGAHYLIDAWKKIKELEPLLFADYKLVIVGGSTFTDEYVDSLKAQAKDHGSIVFTDWQSGKDLEELYANASMLVHPTENEGMSLSILQAMSYGKAVLTSDIVENKELIENPELLFKNTDSENLAKKIINLLKNPDIIKQAEIENKEKAVNEFNWKNITNETEEIYNQDKQKTSAEIQIAEA